MFSNERGFELYESSITVNPAAKSKTSPRIFGGCAVLQRFGDLFGVNSKRVPLPPPPARSSNCAGRSSATIARASPRRSSQTKVDLAQMTACRFHLPITSAGLSMPNVNVLPACFSRIFITSAIVSVQNRGAVRLQSFNQFRFRRSNVFNRAEIFEMNRRNHQLHRQHPAA